MPKHETYSVPPELLAKAIEQMANSCEGDDGCIHAEAIHHNHDAIEGVIAEGEFNVKLHNLPSVAMQHLVSGIHIGYRLAQLEMLPPDKVN